MVKVFFVIVLLFSHSPVIAKFRKEYAFEFVNDVPARVGEIQTHPVLG
jgi:hypothetical protein